MTISTLQNRHRGTQSDGRAFSQEQIEAMWQKACDAMETHPLLSTACKTFSKAFKEGTHVLDDYGHVLFKEDYGLKGKHGWEIDHIDPDGSDDIDNLQPLQWENNVDKSDGSLKCNVTANGTKNVKSE